MKRSSSAPSLENDSEKAKKFKPNEENSKAKKFKPNEENSTSNTREYLQLTLARIVELQRQIDEGIYVTDETTSDLDESGSEEDIMKEVLTRVFQDLPGTSKALTTIINSTSRPTIAQLKTTRNKGVQLSGFECCRRVAVNFVKNSTHPAPLEEMSSDLQRRYVSPMEFEARKRMSESLDLHLAVKQRDYTARLMRE